jgi:hypothetical protein
MSKKKVCTANTSHFLSIARFNSGPSLARGGYLKRLAETPRLGLNDGYRAFQYNRGTCGGRAGVDEHDQTFDLSPGPLSAVDAYHVAQSGVSGLVPK